MTAAENTLKLREELRTDAWVLYKETDSGLVFTELYNSDFPDEAYTDGIVAVPLTSSYISMDFLKNGTAVWNVIGSSGDGYSGPLNPNAGQWRSSHNWSEIWSNLTNEIMMCCVTGQVFCNHSQMCGGHMQLTDPQGQDTPVGTVVHIIPICSAHNNSSVTGQLVVSGGFYDSTGNIGVPTVKIRYRM